jgi:flagellar FliJ protein
MKSRQSLIRFKRFQVDQKRAQLAQIENMIAEFHRMAEDLDNQIADEEAKAGISDVAHFAYPTFARAAAQRRDNLMNSAGELDGQLRDAQDALAEAIEELKKVEILEERSVDRERQEEASREQAEMDEIGLRMGVAQSA